MSAEIRVHQRFDTAGLLYDVEVPVHGGGFTRTCVVGVRFDVARDVLSIEVSGELLDQNVDGVTAAVQMAFRAIKDDRQTYGDLWRCA